MVYVGAIVINRRSTVSQHIWPCDALEGIGLRKDWDHSCLCQCRTAGHEWGAEVALCTWPHQKSAVPTVDEIAVVGTAPQK
jgi:hypothetical protein